MSAWGISGPGGSAHGRVGGVCSGGCLLLGGVVSQHALRQTSPLWTESQTPVKTLPWPNFVAAGKYYLAPSSLRAVITGNYSVSDLCKNQIIYSLSFSSV